jgi:AraC-like DNA-binding protein
MRSGDATQRIDLVQGRHYSDAKELGAVFRRVGDGTEIETAGQTDFDEETYRVDVLSFEVVDGLVPDRFILHDLGTPASFAIFDVVFEFEEIAVCPFRGMGQKVGLGDIGSIMRLADRVRFERALQQLSEGVMNSGDDLDEARGLVLTFQAAVTAGLLEMGGSRNTHRYLLDSARALDEQKDCSVIAEVAVESLRALTRDIFGDGRTGTQHLIDDALEYVERSFGEGINDAMVAERLGLSTSHFRHLFKQATRQPFHQYMLALRLEKSREMILQTDMGIAEISQMCGFASPAHFSRVFSGRFGAAPSVLRGADK